MKILPQPPEFVSRPWFAITVRVDNVGTTLGLVQLLASLRTQLGWPADVPLGVRLQHIKVFGPLVSFASGPLVPINVAFQDFIAENIALSGAVVPSLRILEQFTRYPDQMNRGCVGYAYGYSHSSLTLAATTAGSDLVLVNATGLGSGSLAMVHLLFRSGTIAPAALIGSVSQNAERSDSEDSEIEVLSAPQAQSLTKTTRRRTRSQLE